MHEAILSATLAWSALEDKMATLLGHITNPRNFGVGLRVYFVPENAATRFAIVDAVMRFVFRPLDEQDPHIDTIYAIRREWASFYNSLGRSRVARNSIVHNVINRVSVGRSKRPTVRLTPSDWDHERRFRVKPGQVPGLSSEDVERAAAKFRALAGQLTHFRSLAGYVARERSKLPEGLEKLIAHRLRNTDHLEGDQTPPEQ